MTAVAPRADQVVSVLTFATLTIPAGQVFQIVTTETSSFLGPGPVYFNVLNLGPGPVYIRDSEDPAAGDQNSETLPALAADNGIFVPDAPAGLRILAGSGGATVTVRVAVPQYA